MCLCALSKVLEFIHVFFYDFALYLKSVTVSIYFSVVAEQLTYYIFVKFIQSINEMYFVKLFYICTCHNVLYRYPA